MISSPVVGSFPVTKGRNSPVPTPMQRTHSSRARQNSTQSVPQEVSRNRPPSLASVKPVNGNSTRASQPEADKATMVNEKIVKESKKPARETIADIEQPVEEVANGNEESRKEIPKPKRGLDKVPKREESEHNGGRTRAERPPSISTSITRGGKASKTATPVSGSFPEPQRPRSGRATEAVIKRSHKKGAGLAAQLAAQAAAAEEGEDEEGSPPHGDEDDDSEPTYCYCNRISFGEMVACDNAGKCPKEWFHLECVGLTRPPAKNGKFSG